MSTERGDLTGGRVGGRGPARSAAPSADRRWLTDPVECGREAGFGVYLHVPFCAHRCGYCDFATYDDRDRWMPRYVEALHTDLARTVAAGPSAVAPPGTGRPDGWPTVTSIFVGGGTPTLLPADDLAGIIAAVGEELEVAGDAEVTVECNPETSSVELFSTLADAGVTRISMGAQSFVPHVLSTLERQHDRGRPLRAVAEAREAGIAEINLDLIYGTPGESEEDWEASLAAAVAAGTDHLSCYALTIHANTPFGARVREGSLAAPDSDTQADRFETARARLAAAGFEHYELANWARGAGLRSDHNLLYWRHGDYLGLGVGAHGHLHGRRWWSSRSIETYVEAVESGASPVTGSEVLDAADRARERLLLGLRLRDGLHPGDVPPVPEVALQEAVQAGLVERACGRLRATEEGWFVLDEAVRRLA